MLKSYKYYYDIDLHCIISCILLACAFFVERCSVADQRGYVEEGEEGARRHLY